MLISIFRENRKITIVDINEHQIDDDCLLILGDILLENRIITQINFNFKNIISGLTLKIFLEKLVNRGIPLKFDLTFNEIINNFKKNLIKEDLYIQIFNNFEIIKKGNINIEIPIESIKILKLKENINRRIPPKSDDFSYIYQIPEIDELENSEWKILQEDISFNNNNENFFLSIMKQKYNNNSLLLNIQ